MQDAASGQLRYSEFISLSLLMISPPADVLRYSASGVHSVPAYSGATMATLMMISNISLFTRQRVLCKTPPAGSSSGDYKENHRQRRLSVPRKTPLAATLVNSTGTWVPGSRQRRFLRHQKYQLAECSLYYNHPWRKYYVMPKQENHHLQRLLVPRKTAPLAAKGTPVPDRILLLNKLIGV